MITLTEYIREDYAEDLEEINIQFKYIISNYFFKNKLIFNASNIKGLENVECWNDNKFSKEVI